MSQDLLREKRMREYRERSRVGWPDPVPPDPVTIEVAGFSGFKPGDPVSGTSAYDGRPFVGRYVRVSYRPSLTLIHTPRGPVFVWTSSLAREED